MNKAPNTTQSGAIAPGSMLPRAVVPGDDSGEDHVDPSCQATPLASALTDHLADPLTDPLTDPVWAVAPNQRLKYEALFNKVTKEGRMSGNGLLTACDAAPFFVTLGMGLGETMQQVRFSADSVSRADS